MKKFGIRRLGAAFNGPAIVAFSLLVGASFPSARATATETVTIDEFRELMIVHPSVVDPFLNGGRSHNGGPNDPGGPWSLRTLLEAINLSSSASGKNDFYKSFFEQWLTTQVADNGASIDARDPALVKSLLLDQFSSVDPTTNKRVYQLWKLPFELIAIVYRPDLRSADGSDPGELRFVYKLVDPTGEDLQFTLNLEYALPGLGWDETTVLNATTWANNFHRLGAVEIGSEPYLRLLEGMTWQATSRLYNSFMETRIRHIRTNELAFASGPGATWQMREFVVSRPSFSKTRVDASSVENTPALGFNGSQTLADFVTANPVLAAPGTQFMSLLLPETIQSGGVATRFLAGASSAGVHWTVAGESQPSAATDNLGLLTCNGCHQDNKLDSQGQMHIPGEMSFYHIKPDVEPGQFGTARLSKFLTTEDPDPLRRDRRPGELKRRKVDLTQLLQLPWTPIWLNNSQ